jgi:hypothetical protein
LTNKMHLGAGRTSFEHIVCPSIDAGAVPLRKYWQDQLALTQGVFEIYRTWGTNPPARVIDLREGRHRKSE